MLVLSIADSCESAPTLTAMVPMRDGVRLATNVYLPEGAGPWPVILIVTPYGKNGAEGWAIAANQRGYACVVQDFRGRFNSEGEDYPVFLSYGWGEKQDGYDTIEWIAGQEWCNGKIGTFGLSAPGIAQNMMAPTRPPHLVCQYVGVAFSSMYHQAVYQGGAFRKELWETWLNENKFDPRNLELTRAHPNYDNYWRAFDTECVAHLVNVPSMFVGGWYDIFNAGTINSFMTIQKGGDGGARGKCRLVMEAYGHGRTEELVFPNAELPKTADAFRWFDIWMKDNGKGIEEIPVVQYFVMGDPEDKSGKSNIWKTADDWPIPAKVTPFYLISDGTLQREAEKRSGISLSYDYDPKNPVPTIGGANLYGSKGPADQRVVESRPDVLIFTSEILKDPVEVTGPVKVRLWASSTATDTDFTAKLCDVYPDGRSILVSDGIIRAGHRESMKSRDSAFARGVEELSRFSQMDALPVPMEPGKIYEFEIDLWNTSIVFAKGHRIRVAISSSNSPRFEPNPNTGRPSGLDDETKLATNTIYLDAEHPSHILLPIVSW